MTATARLEFRQTSAAEPDVRTALKRLVADIFDVDVTPLDRLGHDPSVVSFGWWHDRDLVANVSLYRQSLVLMGERVDAFGVQSVATRPHWRGRGLFRDLMARALAYADHRSGLVLLWTSTPGLYTRVGFRSLQEAIFTGPVAGEGTAAHHRRLSLADDDDLALLLGLFARRSPTSDICAATDHPALFLLKAATEDSIRLEHLPDLDAVVAVETPGDLLVLRDVVAPVIPPLSAIVAALGVTPQEVRVMLTPDRLAWQPTRTSLTASRLMARGFYLPEGLPAMLTTMHI